MFAKCLMERKQSQKEFTWTITIIDDNYLGIGLIKLSVYQIVMLFLLFKLILICVDTLILQTPASNKLMFKYLAKTAQISLRMIDENFWHYFFLLL